ncbi:MAG: two-component system, OmpR family, heavy metal sensor histidine kinase CusS [Verrucomicrobiota bacterium]
MFSKPAEPRSIASQLVLLFTLAAALLLCCGLGFLYWIVVRHAFEEDNAVLADRITELRAELNKPGGMAAISEELRTLQPGGRVAYWVRIIDFGGRTVAETPGMNLLLPPSIFPADAPQDYGTDGKLFSVTSASGQAGGINYTLQIAQDRSADERFMKNFAALLAITLALGIVAAAVIAFTVTKRSLRPLAEMTRSLKRVGPKHLHERTSVTSWPRELQPMVIAFDDMLDRLEDSFTRLSQFSADLAHELRTPIANIRGEGEVALTRARTPDEYREVIESSVSECQRLSGIVDNLLFLARAEAAEGPLQRTAFDGRAAVEKIRSYYEAVAEERGVSITVLGEGAVHADPVLFGRALSNLVENGLRFTPSGGTIEIAITDRGAMSEVSVKDSGCGIAPEHLSRIFDRFYRVDSSRSSEGSGLGLALVRSIMHLHGGSAVVKSEPGRGTTVTLTFPNAGSEAGAIRT